MAAAAGIVLTAPLLLLLLAGSAIVFRANPFFVQERVGRHGRLIPVPKIRSIPADTPPSADKYELANYPIPRWGVMLRRLHLDELPQLVSVLVGDMSLVGPRPEMPWLADRFDPTFAARRATVRPGITGLWQVSEAAGGLIVEAPEYDEAYVRHLGLRLDAWILWQTVRMLVPGRRAAVSLSDLPPWAQAPRQHADALYMASSGGN